MRRSFARGTLADWTGWLPAREFASRSGAMNLEQVGPLDVQLLCRFGASPLAPSFFPPLPPPSVHAVAASLLLPKGTFAFTPSSSPLPSPPSPLAALLAASLHSSPPSFARATLLYFSFHPLSTRLFTSIRLNIMYVYPSHRASAYIRSVHLCVYLSLFLSLSLRRLFSKQLAEMKKIFSYHECYRVHFVHCSTLSDKSDSLYFKFIMYCSQTINFSPLSNSFTINHSI